MRPTKWTVEQLTKSVKESTSYRQVLEKLGLKEAGGNYAQLKCYIARHSLETKHFQGQGWNKGNGGYFRPLIPLNEILIKDSSYQSYKLRNRLFREGLKQQQCEECGWSKKSLDGRIPVELDHINGNHTDNRLENLRILCPNCHSLKSTHRGRNKRMG